MAEAFLDRAIQLAVDSVADGGGPFGAVIAKDGREIATGTNRVTRDLDPSAHAEITAIRAACQEIGDFQLTGAVIYCSCEPCPMCLAACYWARLSEIVFAADHATAAAAGFDDSFLYEQIALPIDARSIPQRQDSKKEGARPFAAWKNFADRVEY